MSRLLTLCFLLLVALSSQAKVMVYDGFYFDPDDSLAYKSRNVGGSPTRYIVGMTGSWAGSGVIGLDDTVTLELPEDFDAAGFTSIGGAQVFNNGSGNSGRGVTRQINYYYNTWPAVGTSMYMRALLRANDKLNDNFVEGNYYGIGLTRGFASTSDSARFLSDTGLWLAFKKVGANISLVAKIGANDFTILDTVAVDTTYIAVAKIDIGAAQDGESDAISVYAASVGSYDPAFDFTATGFDVPIATGPSKKTAGSDRFVNFSVCGQYGPSQGRAWFDEFCLATTVEEVVLKRIKGAPRVKSAACAWNGATGFTVSGTAADNAADAVSVLAFDDAGALVQAKSAGSSVAAGSAVQATVDGLASGRTYALAFESVNAVASITNEVGYVYAGTPSLVKVCDAQFTGEVPAELTVSRAAADDLPLTLSYTVKSGDAQEGVHYVKPSGVVTIPAGETSATIEIVPINHATFTSTLTLSVALGAGSCFGGGSPVEVKLVPSVPPEEYNVWLGAQGTSDGLASTAANWSKGVPTAAQDILVDGDWGTADIIWDAGVNGLPDHVANWEQRASYTGTVVFRTTYPEYAGSAFKTFTVDGTATVNGGAWTCPVSFTETDPTEQVTLESLRAGRVYRLSVAAAAMSVGAAGSLDVTGKGQVRELSANATLPTTVSSYGGRSVKSTLGAYGSVTAPDDIAPACVFVHGESGVRYFAAGGGALRLAVTGALVVDGAIRADGGLSPFVETGKPRASAAGGSVWITAASVLGTGAITADSPDLGGTSKCYSGTGGRIAVVATGSVAADTLQFSAGYSRYWWGAAAGTVYWKDATTPNGKLGILNRQPNNDANLYDTGASTPLVGSPAQTYDGIEFFGPGLLEVAAGETLTLPNGFASIASSDTTARGGLLVNGGAIAAGAGPHVLQGAWYCATVSNFVFNGNVTVKNKTVLGLPPIYQKIPAQCHPTNFYVVSCTVNGDLDVQSTGFVKADRAGVCYAGGSNIPSDMKVHGHGGRTSDIDAHDSYVDPQLPGGDTYSGEYGTDSSDLRLSGGLIKLTVTGTFNMDGKMTVKPTSQGSVNESGAINLRVGRLTGSGMIDAGCAGTSHTPGIAAVRLMQAGATFDDFSGTISAKAGGGSHGTVYRQTAADGEGGGVLTITGAKVNGAYVTTPVQLPAAGYGGDGKEGLSRVRIEFVDHGHAKVALNKARYGSLSLSEGSQLDVNGMWSCSIGPVAFGAQQRKRGTYTLANMPDFIGDSSATSSGVLRIGTPGMQIFIR